MKYLPLFFVAVVFMVAPLGASASDDLEVAGWLPYWRAEESTKNARKHLGDIDTLHPFVYIAQQNGTISSQSDLEDSHWRRLFRQAKKDDVEVIPTIMWSDGAATHAVLSDSKLRAKHVKEIAQMVEDGDFDGVDIDYEAKRSETKDYFSRFLEELKEELDGKILACTIEARTPPSSLYKVPPATIAYANDYDAIAEHCDRVEIMAYDQQRADIKLNEERAGMPYMPVADVDWVEKVIQLAIKDIPADKIMLGIPSYGTHYEVTVAPNWFRDYRRIGALNMPDMLDVAKENKVKPSRNKAGEMSFTYLPKSATVKIPTSIKAPKNTPSGNVTAARALAYADKTGKEVKFNIGWYSDAEAMMDKVDLARKYDLRGVALFKIDGEEDQKFWRLLND